MREYDLEDILAEYAAQEAEAAQPEDPADLPEEYGQETWETEDAREELWTEESPEAAEESPADAQMTQIFRAPKLPKADRVSDAAADDLPEEEPEEPVRKKSKKQKPAKKKPKKDIEKDIKDSKELTLSVLNFLFLQKK